MEKVIVRNKPSSNLFYVLLCMLLSTFFIWYGLDLFTLYDISIATVILGVAVLLSILGAGFFVLRTFDRSPTITFDDEGVSSKYFFTSKVYWNEIAEVVIDENDMIILKLNNETKSMREIQSSKFLKKFPHLAFSLSFVGANMNANEALEIIYQKANFELD